MTLKANTATLFIVGALLAASASSLNSQTPPQTLPYHKIVLEPEAWNWTKEAWSGDNAPYHDARIAIEGAIKSPKRLKALLTQYKAEAKKNPENPLAIYRWGYAAYKITDHQDIVTEEKILDGLQQDFQDVPSPRAYDYARLRFLIGETYTAHRQAAAIGERLLAHDKKDYIVAYALASIYLNADYPARVEEAISLCTDMEQQYPSRASTYTLVGEAYVIRWHRDHASAEARLVVENYQKYLDLTPPKDEFRKRAQQIIDEYQKKI